MFQKLWLLPLTLLISGYILESEATLALLATLFGGGRISGGGRQGGGGQGGGGQGGGGQGGGGQGGGGQGGGRQGGGGGGQDSKEIIVEIIFKKVQGGSGQSGGKGGGGGQSGGSGGGGGNSGGINYKRLIDRILQGDRLQRNEAEVFVKGLHDSSQLTDVQKVALLYIILKPRPDETVYLLDIILPRRDQSNKKLKLIRYMVELAKYDKNLWEKVFEKVLTILNSREKEQLTRYIVGNRKIPSGRIKEFVEYFEGLKRLYVIAYKYSHSENLKNKIVDEVHEYFKNSPRNFISSSIFRLKLSLWYKFSKELQQQASNMREIGIGGFSGRVDEEEIEKWLDALSSYGSGDDDSDENDDDEDGEGDDGSQDDEEDDEGDYGGDSDEDDDRSGGRGRRGGGSGRWRGGSGGRRSGGGRDGGGSGGGRGPGGGGESGGGGSGGGGGSEGGGDDGQGGGGGGSGSHIGATGGTVGIGVGTAESYY